MKISTVDGIKIKKYLNQHSVNKIYYLDLCDAIGKRDKISYSEFLEFFTNSTVKELQKNEKIQMKYMIKIVLTIDTFLAWAHDENEKVSENIINEIRNFKRYYQEYLNRVGIDVDSEFNDCLNIIEKQINECYPAKENETNIKVDVTKEDLVNLVKKLKKEIEDLTKELNRTKKISDNKTEKIENLNKKIKVQSNELEDKTNEIKRIIQGKEDLIKKIDELEQSINEAKEKNNFLSTFKEKYTSLILEFNKLNKIMEELKQEKIEQENNEERIKKIKSLIYQKLILGSSSIDDLLKYLKQKNIKVNKEEIYEILNSLKTKISIENDSLKLIPTYKITEPQIITDKKFAIDIPDGTKCYDIILVSDFHINSFNCGTRKGLDMLYDYCVQNNINLILNLGDFYDGIKSNNINFENAELNYQLIEETITKMPKVDGIYHAILGGNHEKNLLRYGYDPIKILTDNREDLLNLGYNHSTITINDDSKIITNIDLHHPDSYNFKIESDEYGINVEEVNDYLNELQGKNKNEAYVNLFGHTHRSLINQLGSYCFIPSYFLGGYNKGATHLKIYFDNMKNIKYMLFMPLNVRTKLIKTSEVVYEKKLLNKKY